MNELFRRLRYLLNRGRFDAELAHDLDVHRELAARAGGRPLGNTLRLREEAREAWGWTWIDRLLQDLRYATRMLRKSPGFTLTAVLMLAIGIGVNVAAFSFFNLMVLRPLPIRDPDTILRFQRRGVEAYSTAVPYPAAAFYGEHSRTLAAVLAQSFARLSLDGVEKPAVTHFVTTNYFDELGAVPTLGRLFDPVRDAKPDAPPAVVLGHWFWQRQFGSDPAIVGQTLHLNGKPATVIGVAALGFGGLFMDPPDLWLPIQQHPTFIAGSRLLTDFSEHDGVAMWGRLQPGITPAAAEEELRALAATLRTQHPADVWEKERLVSEPGGYGKGTRSGFSKGTGSAPDPRGELYTSLLLIGALSLLILAASCGNLGSLLLARGVAREREMSIRAAVGAGSRRLVRQLFTESLLLAMLGAAAGLGLGYAVLRTMMAVAGAPAWLDFTPDWRVTLFAVGMGVAASMLFGLAPAFQVARHRPRGTLARQILIGLQVAASCVLLVVAALLVRALDRVRVTHPGFEYQRVVTIDPQLGTHAYTPDRARAYLDAMQSRLRELPGVQAVTLALIRPMGNTRSITEATIDGRTIGMHLNHVEPAYFETMRIPLLRGRNLRPGETRAVIVSASLAERAWPGQEAIGKTIPFGEDASGTPLQYPVVGIAGNARTVALEDPDAVEIYFLMQPDETPAMSVVVRTALDANSLALAVPALARAIDPEIFPQTQSLKVAFGRKLEAAELSALSVSVLGASALLLACLGIVGLVAYAVSQRTKEIGIRIALGAKRAHVLGVVLRQFSRPVGVGLLVGLGLAAMLSQLMRRELYGLSHLDPLAYLAAIAVFVITVAVAALFPARRALRVDPLRALRVE